MFDRQMFVQSFIDVPTWDAAGWKGTYFVYAPDLSEPPTMGLMYGNGAAARRIFEGLRKRLGVRDPYEELRISIIEGDIPGQEAGYSVTIGSNIENVVRRARANGHELDPHAIAYTIVRVHRMNPKPRSPHLEMFKKSYQRHRHYGLIYAVGDPDSPVDPKAVFDFAITKREILFRRVEDLNEKDLDSVVLGPASGGSPAC